jgi:hypothetical protein
MKSEIKPVLLSTDIINIDLDEVESQTVQPSQPQPRPIEKQSLERNMTFRMPFLIRYR